MQAFEDMGCLENAAIPRKTNAWLSHFPSEKPLVSKVCRTIWPSLQFRISKYRSWQRVAWILASHFYHHFPFIFVEHWHSTWQMQDRRHAIYLWSTLEKVLNSEISFAVQKVSKSQKLEGFYCANQFLMCFLFYCFSFFVVCHCLYMVTKIVLEMLAKCKILIWSGCSKYELAPKRQWWGWGLCMVHWGEISLTG